MKILKTGKTVSFSSFVLTILLCGSTVFLSACTAENVPASAASGGAGQPTSSVVTASSAPSSDSPAKPEDNKKNEQDVRAVVENFGKVIKNVSLEASESVIKQAMKASYAQYLTPNLLENWEGHPSVRAAGKLPNGPWPDHIELSNVVKSADGSYSVKGTLNETASKDGGSVRSKRSAEIKVVRQNEKWLIDEVLFGTSVPAKK